MQTYSLTRPFSGIREASDYLEQAVNYEKLPVVDYDRRNFNLDRMELLLNRFGRPHERFRSIHVAGTKGKGSSAAIIESCLRSAGIRTGLYTSPHMSSVCERMRISGTPCPEQRFCRLLDEKRPVIDELRSGKRELVPTYFELITALSFEIFARSQVDWAVVEVGLGGRLDATNILRPEICLITPVGFDHMDKLGDCAASIAAEKAGILKPGIPFVLGRQDYPEAGTAVLDKAAQIGCEVWEVGKDVLTTNLEPVIVSPAQSGAGPGWSFDIQGPGWSHEDIFLPLPGRHQVYNAASGIGVVELLKQKKLLSCTPRVIRDGIGSSRCEARVELIMDDPPLVLDTAHTAESAVALVEALSTHFPGYNISFVFGCSSDKNHEVILATLAGLSGSITLTRSASPRATPVEELARSARSAGFTDVRKCYDPAEAVRGRLEVAGSNDLTCATGSFFVAGEIKAKLDNIARKTG